MTPLIRRLCWNERHCLLGHLLRLSPRDRYRRFGGYLSHSRIEDYVGGKQWFLEPVVGAYVEGQLCGAGELAFRSPALPRVAEIGLSVETAFQRRGIGTSLFRRILLLARNRFATRVQLTTQPDNFPVRCMAKAAGLRLYPDDGQLTGRIELSWPDGASLLNEAFLESWSFLFAPPTSRCGSMLLQ